VLLLVAALTACDDAPPTMPEPSPTPDTGVHPGSRSGPTRILFVEASPAPGSTLTGCGPDAAGCAGRVSMTFDLVPTASGHVLWTSGFLHADTGRACLTARTAAFDLRAGVPARITLAFDQSDDCRTPVQVATMAVVVEGTVEVGSRQEFSVRYELAP
jgi:hypothetical protein